MRLLRRRPARRHPSLFTTASASLRLVTMIAVLFLASGEEGLPFAQDIADLGRTWSLDNKYFEQGHGSPPKRLL